MEDGEHVVDEIIFIIVGGKPDVAVGEVLCIRMFDFSQNDFAHIEIHHVTYLFGELALSVYGEKFSFADVIHLRSFRYALDKGNQTIFKI